MKRRFRILLWSVPLLVLILILAAWLGRDVPRQQVASALARALEADVDLGRLEIRGSDHYVLHQLTIRDPRRYPWLRSVSAERLTVVGRLSGILDNRFDTLALDGAVATLRAYDGPPPEREPAGDFVAGRLTIANSLLVVAGGGGESRFTVEGEVTGIGRDVGGEIRLRAEPAALVPMLSFIIGADRVARFTEGSPLDLGRQLDTLSATIGFGRNGVAADLTVTADGAVRFHGEEWPPFPFPRIDLILREDGERGWRFTGEARSPGLLDLDLEGGMAPDGGGLRVDRAELVTADPAVLLHGLGFLPEGAAARGQARLTLVAGDAAPPEIRVWADLDHLVLIQRDLGALCPLELDYRGTLEQREVTGAWPSRGGGTLTSGPAGTLRADGSIILAGADSRVDADWSWGGPDIAALRRVAAALGLRVPERYRLDGAPGATGRCAGPVNRLSISGRLVVNDLDFCLESESEPGCDLQVSEGRLDAEFARGDDGGIGFTALRLSGDLEAGPLEAVPLHCDGTGRFDPETLEGRFRIESASFGELGRISGDGHWDPRWKSPLTAVLHLEEARLPAIRRALVPLTGTLLPGYELEADLTGSGRARWSAAEGWRADGTAEMGEAWFASEDGARAVQGLAGVWQVSASAGPDGDLAVEASTRAGGFQLLWGSVYGDFGELAPRIRVAAGLDATGGGDGQWRLEGELEPQPGFRLQASLAGGDGPERRFSVGLGVDDLAAAFDHCARRPLGESLPLLLRLDAGGAIDAVAEGRYGDEADASLSGWVRLHRLRFTGEEQTMAVTDLDLDLPLDLVWGHPVADGARPVTGQARQGRVGFGELRLDTLVFPATDSGLVVRGDTVSLEAAQRLPLFGGAATFHHLTLADLLGGDRRLEAELALEGLQLGEVSRAFGWPNFEGELHGRLPRVVLSPDRLAVDGVGEMSLFGGTVTVRDISGEDVLSRYPRLIFSAGFQGIDLAQVTRTFDFGEVTGILDGRIDDCRLFAGTPVGFSAEMHSVERKGVPQTITVKAINNIAILGTGGRVTVFDRGIHALLDRYTYEQFGVQMRLEQDLFYLRGTESRSGRELFLKGRLPFRIDVVNAEPGKGVSFSTMLDRLAAIDFSRAATTTGR